jgi:hypothetical protein
MLQTRGGMSVAGVCHIISCILNNDKLSTVYFDYTPSNCVHRVAWYKEGLAVPPVDIARKGWAAVLKYLRKVRGSSSQQRAVAITITHTGVSERWSASAACLTL